MKRIALPPLTACLLSLCAACGDNSANNSTPDPILPDAGPVTDAGTRPDASTWPEDLWDAAEPDEGDDESDAGADASEPEPEIDPWEFDDVEKELNDESDLSGPRAHFDPNLIDVAEGASATPAEFLAFPFPADHRRHSDGKVRFDDFPRPESLAQSVGDKLLDRYLSPTGGVDGFSLNGAVHVAFDAPLNVDAVPTSPDAFLEADAVFKIVDIDPKSPERGEVRPLRWEYQATEGNYAAKNSLAIAPAWGFPLREGTTYALVITDTTIVGANDGMPLRQPRLLSALLANRAEKPEGLSHVSADLYETMRAAYAPLRQTLNYLKVDIDEVAAATVFTTQNVTNNLRRIQSHLSSDIKSGKWVPEATYARTETSYWYSSMCSRTPSSATWATCIWNGVPEATLYQLAATFNGRNYQQGTVPYLLDGGNFRFSISNEPLNYADETLTLVVTVPETPMVTADGCVPIVEIAHGTGGDAYSGLGDRTSSRLAARGLASVGMDQPLHGDRFDATGYIENGQFPTDGLLGILLGTAFGGVDALDEDLLLSLVNFNFLNLDSARSSMRQSAIDTMALTHLIARGGLDVPAEFSPTGAPIRFCRDKIGFFGHSQGGLSGAIAAGIEHRIGAYMLSAGGGGLGITILDRKDFGDFPSILGMLFGLKTSDGETLTELHVLMSVIQTVVDVTDPINYAPFWRRDTKLGEPTSQLLTSSLDDSMTPHRTARALATSARLSPINPLILDLPEFDWAGVPALNAPMSGNYGTTTNAFIQWDNSDMPASETLERWSGHFLVYHRPEAINASMRFLQTYFAPETADGLPLIERDPTATVKASKGNTAQQRLKVSRLPSP